jgi:NADPH:quinone reductase-like Zn-dependent oxidoreductase
MAEIVALKPVNIGPKPENLSFAEAAALPLAGLTAWQMLVKRADARSGETVLVLGAGSGVGSMGIQIGKHLGCQVIATASTGAQTKLAKQLGADEVIDHRDPEYFRTVKTLTAGRGADVVFEHIGAATWKSSLRSLAVGGRLVSCGATTGYMGEINIQHLFYKRQSILGSTMGTLDDFNAVLDLASKGVLKPIVDRSFPFREIGAAHSYLEHDHKFGKVVLEGWS